MVQECGQVKLKTSEELIIKKLIPPDERYSPRLANFFPPTSSVWDVEKVRRAKGQLAGLCRDHFFVGEVNGKLVGNVWYTTSQEMAEVATLGFVYTEPPWRRRGIATRLMEVALEDFFRLTPGPSAIYLNTGADNPAHKIYTGLGFEDYCTRRTDVIMRLARPSGQEFDAHYFKWEGKAHIRDPHRGDLPRFEALFNRPGWIVKDMSHGILGKVPYEKQFILTMNAVEGGYACSLVLENPKGRVIGWAILTFYSQAEGWKEDWALLDFLVCLEYEDQALELVAEVLKRGHGLAIRSHAAREDQAKVKVLKGLSFRLEYEILMEVEGQKTPIEVYYRHSSP